MAEHTFFLDWRRDIHTKFQGLFSGSNSDDEDDGDADAKLAEYDEGVQSGSNRKTISDARKEAGEDLNQKWGWVGVIYSLCGGDITKTEAVVSKPAIECLVWLSYEKEMEIRK